MQKNKLYRSRALDVLEGNWKPYVLASLLFFVITLAITIPFEFTAEKFPFLSMALLYPLLFLISMPLSYGYYNGLVDKYRGEEKSLTERMFGIFKAEYVRALKAVLLVFALMMLFLLGVIAVAALVAWGLSSVFGDELFFGLMIALMYIGMIPMIVWAYSVTLTTYLAHDRQDLKIRECLSLSRKMMYGYKWKLFLLQLSFIGWVILCIFTLGIGMLWLMPYQYMATAIFYDDRKREYFGEDVPAAEEPAADNIEVAVEAMADDDSAE